MKTKILTTSLIVLSVLSLIGLLVIGLIKTYTPKEAPQEVLKLTSDTEEITIEDYDTSGYQIASTMYFTPNIDKEKAFNELKPYMLFLDGKPVKENYEVNAQFSTDHVTLTGKYPNGKSFAMYTTCKEIEALDNVEFMTATPSSFSRYAIVVAKNSINKDCDINKLALYALHSTYVILKDPVFDLTYNNSLNTTNNTWSESTYQAGNLKYHSIMTNVRILNDITKEDYVGTPNNDTYSIESFSDGMSYVGNKVSEAFNSFKTEVQNNQTLKIITITASTIFGIAIIYILFLILRKLWHVIKN